MVSESVIDVRYPDTDPMGIVHHAVYPIWYEIARMDYFAALGYSYAYMRPLGLNPPMVDLHVLYKAPVTYPGKVTVRTKATFCAPKKLRLHYDTYFDGKLVNSCDTFHIWTGPDQKSYDMEKNQPDMYAAFLNALEPED